MDTVYMDHAATTPVAPEVFEAMSPFLTAQYGNPSSLYKLGREAKRAVEEARATVARALDASPEEIVFTSGGTEADNAAIKGVMLKIREKRNHIITSAIEHHAVLKPVRWLETQGFTVTIVPVDENGLVDPAAVESAVTPQTGLITVMHANNEIGTIQPVDEIGQMAWDKKIRIHTDAVQSFGHVPVSVERLNVDLLSLSAHKLNGPKGVGALYVRGGTRMVSFMQGGGQEGGRRASTENVAGIIGLAKAVELAEADREAEAARIKDLRDKLMTGVEASIDRVIVNGDRERRLPNNASFCFEGVEGESLLLTLDTAGVCSSSGSACTAGSAAPSHVLSAIGRPAELANGSLRLTLGRGSTAAEVDYVLGILPGLVANLRAMNPAWKC